MCGKNLRESGYVCIYMCDWITLLYSRYYHNLVNQLYVNKTLKGRENTKTKRKKMRVMREKITLQGAVQETFYGGDLSSPRKESNKKKEE